MRKYLLISRIAFLCVPITILAMTMGSQHPGKLTVVTSKEQLLKVNGSAPGACTSNYTYYPCSEGNANPSCWSKDGTDQMTCVNFGQCFGCSSGNTSERCQASRPWNSICQAKQDLMDGCGNVVDSKATCSWDNITKLCRCVSINTTEDKCVRYQADVEGGRCTYTP